MKTHKVVLSACSPFFQSLFADNPCAHPIIIMNQTRLSDLRAIVEFMYRGSVNVSQDQLPSLLQTAETLKVKGLAEVTTTECVFPAANAEGTATSSTQVKKTSQPVPHKRKHTPPPPAVARKQTSKSDTDDSSPRDSLDHDSRPAAPSMQSLPAATSKSRPTARHSIPASRRTFDHSYSDDKTNWVPPDSERNSDPGPCLALVPVLPEPCRSLPEAPDRSGDCLADVSIEGTMCRVCSRVFSSKGNLKRHMLMHRPYRPKHQCNLCFKLFSWPGDLRTHIRVVHQEGGKMSSSLVPLGT